MIYIGIEAVSSRRSLAAMADESGNIISAIRSPFGLSLSTTPRITLRDQLRRMMSSLVRPAGLNLSVLNRARVCIGMAGVTFPYDKIVDLPNEFNRLRLFQDFPIICTGDAEIVFASHAGRSIGSAILSTMGAAGYACNKSIHCRSGGWGPVFGDPGSGFSIGQAALMELNYRHDTRSQPSELWRCIENWLQRPVNPTPDQITASILWRRHISNVRHTLKNETDIRSTIFGFAHDIVRSHGFWLWRVVVSSLAIPIIEKAYNGYQPARKIIDKTLNDLVNQHELAINTANQNATDGPIVLYGGVITHNSQLRRELTNRLLNHYRADLTIIYNRSSDVMRPVCGALLFALGHSTTEDLRLPNNRIRQTMLNSIDGWDELDND